MWLYIYYNTSSSALYVGIAIPASNIPLNAKQHDTTISDHDPVNISLYN